MSDKILKLDQAQTLYQDLRERIDVLPTNEDITVTDVQVNGTSILNNGIANVPIADANTPGVVKVDYTLGVGLFNNALAVSNASDTDIKNASTTRKPINPALQHKATFYGLAKAAGDTTQSASNNSVGVYTENAKIAIRTMLGATSNNVIAVQDTQPTDTDTKIWLPETAETPVEVPTVAEMNAALSGKVDDVQVNGTSVITNGVANVPIASTSGLGVVQIDSSLGIGIDSSSHKIFIDDATIANVKAGTESYKPIVPRIQDAATFYGLAKAAGVDMASSSNPVGTYTDEAKIAIRSMLGVQNFNPQSIAIVANGDTHAAITSGQYVYVQNHSTLTEGLYTARAAIAANDTLSSSNLVAVSGGGLNALTSKYDTVDTASITWYSNHTPTRSDLAMVYKKGQMCQMIFWNVSFANNITSDTKVGTIPAGYRPPEKTSFYGYNRQHALCRGWIGPDGVIRISLFQGDLMYISCTYIPRY